MLGLSLVSILDKTLDEARHYDYEDDEFEYTKTNLRGSNVNNAILEDKQFRSIFLGAVRRRSTSGYDLIERYNKHLNRGDDTLFSQIPLEILEEIVLSVREASILHKLSQTSKRIRIFLSEPRILSLLTKKEYPDDKIAVILVAKGRYSTFEDWYHKTFFTDECTGYNNEVMCANTAFRLKKIDYLIKDKLVPYLGVTSYILEKDGSFFDGIVDQIIEYANVLYGVAEETVNEEKITSANGVANILISEYIEYSDSRGVYFDLPSIFKKEDYEGEFMRSYFAQRLIHSKEKREVLSRILKSSEYYEQREYLSQYPKNLLSNLSKKPTRRR